MALTTPLAVADGSFVFMAFVIAMFFAVVWAYYTRSGTDIAQRPSDGLGGDDEPAAPGTEGASRITGKVDGEQDPFNRHGTQ